MKPEIHPDYQETVIVCACGTTYKTRSTKQNIKLGICAACHPFFTGEQKFVDTAGRVDKFQKRYGTVRAPRAAKKLSSDKKVFQTVNGINARLPILFRYGF